MLLHPFVVSRNISGSDINSLVLNYLVVEGFKDAAEQFCAETGLEPPVDLNSISERMRIRTAIQDGQIEQAMALVNDLNPEILDTTPDLFFHLQQQRLIELIRAGNLEAALQFAQEELAPRGEENPVFLTELEKTMSLLVFENQAQSPVGHLLQQSQRQQLASEVNAAILASRWEDAQPKLVNILKMLVWVQRQLDEKASYPHIRNLALGQLEGPDAAASS